jgi:hypothetical protein
MKLASVPAANNKLVLDSEVSIKLLSDSAKNNKILLDAAADNKVVSCVQLNSQSYN